MATENRGIAPADPTTTVGQVRYLIGDLDYEEYDTPEAGYGLYANFSDGEISGFLAAGGDSINRASGYAYLRLAALAAAGAISWKSDDQSLDAKQVATEYRLLANIAFDQADVADAGGASAFDLSHPYSSCSCADGECIHQELAPYTTGCFRCGTACMGWC
jgi:hypothetical protein